MLAVGNQGQVKFVGAIFGIGQEGKLSQMSKHYRQFILIGIERAA